MVGVGGGGGGGHHHPVDMVDGQYAGCQFSFIR